MKKFLIFMVILLIALSLTACNVSVSGNGGNSGTTKPNTTPTRTSTAIPEETTKPNNNSNSQSPTSTKTKESEAKSKMKATGIKIKITVSGQVLTATLNDNATTRSLIAKFPLTVPMMDLYSREMCYRFSDELPTDNVQTTGYEVGEIIYWPPRHSFVILYAQNDEHFDMQKIGRIDSDVEIFEKTGDVDVKFELL